MLDGTPPGRPTLPPDGGLVRADIVLPETTPLTVRQVWGPEAVRLHRVDKNGSGYFTVTPDFVTRVRALPVFDEFHRFSSTHGVAVLTPTDAHMAGHLSDAIGLKLLAGHYSVRTALAAAAETALGKKMESLDVIAEEIAEVNFLGVILPGNTALYDAEIIGQEGDSFYANVRATADGTDVFRANGMKFTTVPADPRRMPQNEGVEAGIQAVSVEGLGKDGMPLDGEGRPMWLGVFKKIRNAKFYTPVYAGDTLIITPKRVTTRMDPEKGGMVLGGADVFKVTGEHVMDLPSMTAGIMKRQEALAQFAA
ncbi:MAG: hypothetical protein Q8Q49_01960 [bacterium]|nr:hypothetical protein [bacterium]